MAGDSYHIRANSWYRLNGVTPGAPVHPLTSIIAALAGGVAEAGGWKNTSAYLQSSGILDPAVTDLLNSQTAASGKPKAYLNWLLMDEQYRYAGGGYEQVGDNEEFKTHIKTGLTVNKNGYLYIYVSNETPNVDVFFDNVQVSHVRGPLMEETHYYPFGLTMAGISSKAAGSFMNRYKFNGGNELQSGEFSDGSGLELYDAIHRLYDPQLGRFGQIDKLSELSIDFTPYGFARNNPIWMNDPLGLKEDTVAGTSPEVIVKSSRKEVASKAMNEMDYGQITGWIDGQRKKGVTVDIIRGWALDNQYLNNNTLDKIMDGITTSALAIRKAQDEAWEAEGRLYKIFLESILLTAGGELLMLAELDEAALLGKVVIEGVANSVKRKIVTKTLQIAYKKFGRKALNNPVGKFLLQERKTHREIFNPGNLKSVMENLPGAAPHLPTLGPPYF